MEANEQPFVPTNVEGLPDLSDIVVCPSETGSNPYDCLLEAILLPIQYQEIFVGLRSPWKGGKYIINQSVTLILNMSFLCSAAVWATRNRKAVQSLHACNIAQFMQVTFWAGKTKLVQAICKAASCTLLSVTNSDLLSRWFGESNM
jgi:hypothetical protein